MKFTIENQCSCRRLAYIPSHHLSSRHGVLVVVRVPVAKIVHVAS